MWGKMPTTVKCPRNDCEYYERKADESPCRSCSCNPGSDRFGREFCYKHKESRKKEETGGN